MIELTASIAWENHRARFNHALDIEAQRFSEGAFAPCRKPPQNSEEIYASLNQATKK